MRVRPTPLAAAVSLAVLLAACGGEDATDPGPEAGASAEDPVAGDVDVAVATTDLGEVLVDGDGMTLYLFTEDPEGTSVCEDDCAAAWPPLSVDGEPTVGDGADPALVGTTERSDGSTQVTYAGAPLYTWASDSEPGDVTGQGVGDVWFVVGPDGEAVTDAGPADEDPVDADEAGTGDELGY